MVSITMSGEKRELRDMANFLVRNVYFAEFEFVQPSLGDMQFIGLAEGILTRKGRKRAKYYSVDRCRVWYDD